MLHHPYDDVPGAHGSSSVVQSFNNCHSVRFSSFPPSLHSGIPPILNQKVVAWLVFSPGSIIAHGFLVFKGLRNLGL